MFRKTILLVFYLFFTSVCCAKSLKVYDVIIPFSAGGASDILFRNLEPHLNSRLKPYNIKLKPVNLPGAGGSIGLNTLMNNETLTFGFFSSFFAINLHLQETKKYSYNSVNFLGFAGFNQMLILSEKYSSLQEMKKDCLKNKTIMFGSSGIGSISHLSSYYFAKTYLDCKEIISIPYKGTSMVYPDLKSKRIDFMADFSNSAIAKDVNLIYEITENDLVSWHIFVANNIKNDDFLIIKNVFESLKNDSIFVKNFEDANKIIKFSENKDINWLRDQFLFYENIIKSIK